MVIMNELRAYAEGRWVEFNGLDQCLLAEADSALGPPLDDQLLGGVFGGEPTQFRRYPATAAAPRGVTAWVHGEVVVGLEISQPDPPAGSLEELGAPPSVIGSELGPAWSQELWPERGLVLHRRDTGVAVIFGLAPFTLERWETDPLRWWRIERRPDSRRG